ncbi:YhjD/YihY/BrkB family envelope integrity protein [Geodermatophilus sp. SYSU D01186]
MRTVHDLRTAGRRLETTVPGRSVRSFVALQGIDRATAIAAQAFTALIPLVLLASGLAPTEHRDLVSDLLVRKFHLEGSAADAVRELFAHPSTASTGVFSVVLLVFSGVSLTRRMQRMYQDAWRLPPRRGVRGSLNAALALAVLLVEISLLFLVRTLVGALPAGWAVSGTISVLGSVLLWTSIPWLLLDRRVSWRRLLPTGALTAGCAGVYALATTVYMPRLMSTYSLRYGLFGVTLALIGWLLCVAFIFVTTTILAAEFDRSPERWATRVRTRLGLEQPAREQAAVGGPPPAGEELPPGDVRPVHSCPSAPGARRLPRHPGVPGDPGQGPATGEKDRIS